MLKPKPEVTETVLDEGYFHTNNGGMTLRVIESAYTRDRLTHESLANEDKLPPDWREGLDSGKYLSQMGNEGASLLFSVQETSLAHYIEVRTGNMGVNSTLRFPIHNLGIRYLVQVLSTLGARLDAIHEGAPVSFPLWAGMDGEDQCSIRRQNGNEVGHGTVLVASDEPIRPITHLLVPERG